MELKITQEDVMLLLNRISEKSYGCVESNLRALSDRGWNPPNRKILDHPYLVGQEKNNGEEQQSAKQVDYRRLNTENGFSGICIDKIISHQMRNGGIKARQKILEENTDIGKNLMEARKLTSVVPLLNVIHSLNDPSLVAHTHKNK